MNIEIEEKLRDFGFVRQSEVAWYYGEGDEALKLFIVGDEYHLCYPKSSKMRKKRFVTKGFPDYMIEKHICLAVMKA